MQVNIMNIKLYMYIIYFSVYFLTKNNYDKKRSESRLTLYLIKHNLSTTIYTGKKKYNKKKKNILIFLLFLYIHRLYINDQENNS